MNQLAVLDRISPPRYEGSVRGQSKPRGIPVPGKTVVVAGPAPIRETRQNDADLYFPYAFAAVAGLVNGSELLPSTYLGFRAQSLIIDNPTGYTIFIPQANRYVGPNTFARVLALYPAIDTLRLLVAGGTVGSNTQITLVATQRRQPESPGYSTISPGSPVVSGAVQILDAGGVNKLGVNGSGQIALSNFPATQPISSTDGAQTTVGNTADSSAASTLVGLLKAAKAALQGTLTVAFSAAQAVTLPAGQAVELLDSAGTNKASISAAGAVKTDGSAVTQPVSGTVGVNNFPASQAVTLPAGQAVELLDSGGTNKASISAAGAVKVDGSAVTQPISGNVGINSPITAAGWVIMIPRAAANIAIAQQNASTTAAQLVAARTTRRRLLVKNNDSTISVAVGPATVTMANGQIVKAGESVEIFWTGLVQVISASGTPSVTAQDEYD